MPRVNVSYSKLAEIRNPNKISQLHAYVALKNIQSIESRKWSDITWIARLSLKPKKKDKKEQSGYRMEHVSFLAMVQIVHESDI